MTRSVWGLRTKPRRPDASCPDQGAGFGIPSVLPVPSGRKHAYLKVLNNRLID